MLITASNTASNKDESYKNLLAEIKQKHIDVIYNLIENQKQNQLYNFLDIQINQLQTLLDGCFLLGELSARTADTIASFGELLSSQIVAAAVQQIIPNTNFKDSREIIKTNSNFGKASVNFNITNSNIQFF